VLYITVVVSHCSLKQNKIGTENRGELSWEKKGRMLMSSSEKETGIIENGVFIIHSPYWTLFFFFFSFFFPCSSPIFASVSYRQKRDTFKEGAMTFHWMAQYSRSQQMRQDPVDSGST
jgi:hypothetical protein